MNRFLFTLILIMWSLAGFTQRQNEKTPPDQIPAGLYAQAGPGASNEDWEWEYPFGTKLTVNFHNNRNFELMVHHYPAGRLLIRQWNPTNNVWGGWRSVLVENDAGNVGIGTTSPQAKLAVNGVILAKEVKVKNDITVPDYVFEPDYDLLTLDEIEAYLREHKHLPEIPSAADIEKEGLNLAEMNLLLLKKVEELTLHLIEKDKTEKKILATVEKLEEEIAQLKSTK